MDNLVDKFKEYCNEHWFLKKYELNKALDLMAKTHCPLSQAGSVVIDYIRGLADEFEIDNDLDDDWFEKEGIDEEDLLFDLDIFD